MTHIVQSTDAHGSPVFHDNMPSTAREALNLLPEVPHD